MTKLYQTVQYRTMTKLYQTVHSRTVLPYTAVQSCRTVLFGVLYRSVPFGVLYRSVPFGVLRAAVPWCIPGCCPWCIPCYCPWCTQCYCPWCTDRVQTSVVYRPCTDVRGVPTVYRRRWCTVQCTTPYRRGVPYCTDSVLPVVYRTAPTPYIPWCTTPYSRPLVYHAEQPSLVYTVQYQRPWSTPYSTNVPAVQRRTAPCCTTPYYTLPYNLPYSVDQRQSSRTVLTRDSLAVQGQPCRTGTTMPYRDIQAVQTVQTGHLVVHRG